MRKLSAQRRRVVTMAASMAAISGVGPLLLRGHHSLEIVWAGLIVVLAVTVIVQTVRLRREEGC